MEIQLQAGMTGEQKTMVTEENIAMRFGSGSVKVYATPALVGLMEHAALSSVQNQLPEGWTTVGSKVNISHLAATPLGMEVTAKAELIEVDRRRLVFKVEAFDEKEKIGEGTHERFIVQLEKFLPRAEAKKK